MENHPQIYRTEEIHGGGVNSIHPVSMFRPTRRMSEQDRVTDPSKSDFNLQTKMYTVYKVVKSFSFCSLWRIRHTAFKLSVCPFHPVSTTSRVISRVYAVRRVARSILLEQAKINFTHTSKHITYIFLNIYIKI